MNQNFVSMLRTNPIIAAARTDEEIDNAVLSGAKMVFILDGDIFNYQERIKRVQESGKLAFIHIDLLHGFASTPYALDYIVKTAKPDGILSTKKSIILKANSLGIMSILRVFALDSTVISSAEKLVKETSPTAVEILPGIVPKVIKMMKLKVNAPIITGGMVDTLEEVKECVKSGASGISTSNLDLVHKFD